MNLVNFPGPGNDITFIGSMPPASSDTFTVTFKMTIGLQGARVLVIADSNGHELEDIQEVLYCDLDILPALDSCTHIDIRNHYERNADRINQAARTAAEDDAL